MKLFSHTLPNGIRIIHHQVNSPVGHCGLLINTGSRDELPNEHGIAHFIEHVIFKGTKKRKTYHILSRMDDVGGELNAYTTKEETCVYSTFLKEDYSRAMDLLQDIVFNSTFPVKELEKEKEVIIDEINSYKDSPSDLILDDFEELVFKDSPMGRNILGTAASLEKLGPEEVKLFIDNNYHTDQMVICSVGQFEPARVLKMASKYFGWVQPKIRINGRQPVKNYMPGVVEKNMDTFQSHIVVGNLAYDLSNPKRTTLSLLNNILGGPGMNCRLSMALREKNGMAYNIESMYTPYCDTGIFTIYFGTDGENVDKSLQIVHRELKKLRDQRLGKLQLHNAIRQFKGQITIANENRENLMLSLGKSYMLYNVVDTLPEIYKKIDQITASEILEIANELFNPSTLSYLFYRQN